MFGLSSLRDSLGSGVLSKEPASFDSPHNCLALLITVGEAHR